MAKEKISIAYSNKLIKKKNRAQSKRDASSQEREQKSINRIAGQLAILNQIDIEE